jgi:hypothetical protein
MRLYTKLTLLNYAIKKLADAKAMQQTAQKAADVKLEQLKAVMRDCLKKSTVDVADEPQKLKLIGWSPKAGFRKANIPNQPTNLQAFAKENASVQLSWSRPAGRQRVLNYIIERREEADGNFIKWAAIANSYKTQIILAGQPHGIKLEYRIKAVNTSGQSQASNTVSVII